MSKALSSDQRARAMRLAGLAALVGAGAWLAKFAVIWAGNGNEDLHGVLQIVGTVALLVAVGIAGWRAVASRGVGLRLFAVLVAWLVLFVVVGAAEEGINAAIDADDNSVLEELVLLVVGVPALIFGLAALRRGRRESAERTT